MNCINKKYWNLFLIKFGKKILMNTKIKVAIIVALNAVFLIAFNQTASFTVDKNIGCGKLAVTFKNTSTGYSPSTTFLWSFSNAIPPLVSDNPGTLIFDTTGIFIIKLELNDRSLAKKVYAYDTIWIRPTPNAFFHIRNVNNNLLYKFTAATTDNKGHPYDSTRNTYKYIWKFKVLNKSDSTTGKEISKNYTPIKTDNFLEEVVTLRVVDWYGCSDINSQTFRVYNKLEAPQVVTPNGDNDNDYFYIPTNGRTVYSLEVFSRSGVVVYQQKSPTIRWDCTTDSGMLLTPGTYWYIIKTVGNTEEGANFNQTGFFVIMHEKN